MNFTVIPAISIAYIMAASVAAADSARHEFSDLTIPEFSELTESQADYVDMQKLNGRFCPDHPFRPGWVMVQPHGHQWKTGLTDSSYFPETARRVKAGPHVE
ncbi:hypothetical protein KUV57_01860 [Epibacterium sp. DP7N7-1]|nr:hypothetical protein [Epibacterium sp. DP7N7-1]